MNLKEVNIDTMNGIANVCLLWHRFHLYYDSFMHLYTCKVLIEMVLYQIYVHMSVYDMVIYLLLVIAFLQHCPRCILWVRYPFLVLYDHRHDIFTASADKSIEIQ